MDAFHNQSDSGSFAESYPAPSTSGASTAFASAALKNIASSFLAPSHVEKASTPLKSDWNSIEMEGHLDPSSMALFVESCRQIADGSAETGSASENLKRRLDSERRRLHPTDRLCTIEDCVSLLEAGRATLLADGEIDSCADLKATLQSVMGLRCPGVSLLVVDSFEPEFTAVCVIRNGIFLSNILAEETEDESQPDELEYLRRLMAVSDASFEYYGLDSDIDVTGPSLKVRMSMLAFSSDAEHQVFLVERLRKTGEFLPTGPDDLDLCTSGVEREVVSSERMVSPAVPGSQRGAESQSSEWRSLATASPRTTLTNLPQRAAGLTGGITVTSSAQELTTTREILRKSFGKARSSVQMILMLILALFVIYGSYLIIFPPEAVSNFMVEAQKSVMNMFFEFAHVLK